ncbi:tRNA dimethylallyltransferase [Luteitalea pratensis]|uniref:tRNA dimethylallyltransferase n=1 Tax=Luteitalea pratensis TaxID=1855912 RepID=A0A143PR55_LUTPR|nr:tRNA (adenosine(37)-N6)-dimethylallyltransferase MiaA [Luteitalea pratensis]AMY11187.1 tRNA dimethylallyltransferase [Luteitalea pratensis]
MTAPLSASGRPLLVAVLGPTATGKSSLGIRLAQAYDGEIVNCDSTAVYRRFDIGTDKVPAHEQGGIAHHLVDVVEPTDIYSAAQFARDAATRIRAISARGRLPMLVGGTGFYFRALVEGLFDGPGRDDVVRTRLHARAVRHGVQHLHRILARVDPTSAARIMPRDEKRLVRALEVWLLTGQPLSAHFAETRPPLPEYDICVIGLRLPPEDIGERVARRVEAQWARGVVQEVRDNLAAGIPREANPFGGLVYRQILEMLDGLRDDAETRALIVRENRQYARRQLIWFRKEPRVIWLDGAGERDETFDAARALIETHGVCR